MGVSERLHWVEQTMKAADSMNIISDQLHPYVTSVFPNGNGVFQYDNIPYHKTQIVLEGFQKHNDEFQLIYCPPNTQILNPK